jgi:DNA polymerase-1
VNTIIQGTAADMMKTAMIAVDRELRERKLRARMVLQIHDELLLETPPDEVDVVRALVIKSMSEAEKLRVPVKVDVAVGRNWLEAK